jgi:peptide methionine sulfoxide reductase MsrB
MAQQGGRGKVAVVGVVGTLAIVCLLLAAVSMGGNVTREYEAPVVMGDESIMEEKAYGTCEHPVQANLRYGCPQDKANQICCHNRHYAEHSGFWRTTGWLQAVQGQGATKYFDSVTGKLLFTAPLGRTEDDFFRETTSHGWPSFRDDEVNWDVVRVLPNGECVSLDGTHLGHNLPDSKGNRYCINLVCVAGNPKEEAPQ